MTIQYIPTSFFNISNVRSIKIEGRGGKENQLFSILPNWNRVNAPLYDFEYISQSTHYMLEVKKQSNLQWFDSGKYHSLSINNQNIVIMFILHDKGNINNISLISLVRFLEWQISYNNHNGWNHEVFSLGHHLKQQYPNLQFKAPAHIKNMIQQSPEIFQNIYDSRIT